MGFVYNVGNYRWKPNGAIYKRVWWVFFKKIEDKNLSFMEGVCRVNGLDREATKAES